MSKKRLLITGFPGTGKTTLGNYFKDKYGYKHIDLENAVILNKLLSNPIQFVNEFIEDTYNDIVMSWGFVPNENQINIVILLKTSGFKLIWFDGNRVAAREAFIKRGTVSESLLNLQVNRINNSNVIQKIKPIIINTFNFNGDFKTKDQIIKEITES